MQVSKKGPLENLYQRAQKDVVNNKLALNYAMSGTVSTATSSNVKPVLAKYSKDVNISFTTIALKRDETPKEDQRQVVMTCPDEPTQQYLENRSNTSTLNNKTKLSKKNSVKTLIVTSPLRKTKERNFYTSYDFAQDKTLTKKPVSKLDLSKRAQGNRLL